MCLCVLLCKDVLVCLCVAFKTTMCLCGLFVLQCVMLSEVFLLCVFSCLCGVALLNVLVCFVCE